MFWSFFFEDVDQMSAFIVFSAFARKKKGFGMISVKTLNDHNFLSYHRLQKGQIKADFFVPFPVPTRPGT